MRTMDVENVEWAIQELALTAERAQDHGLTPMEFMAALVKYVEKFAEDHTNLPADQLSLLDAE